MIDFNAFKSVANQMVQAGLNESHAIKVDDLKTGRLGTYEICNRSLTLDDAARLRTVRDALTQALTSEFGVTNFGQLPKAVQDVLNGAVHAGRLMAADIQNIARTLESRQTARDEVRKDFCRVSEEINVSITDALKRCGCGMESIPQKSPLAKALKSVFDDVVGQMEKLTTGDDVRGQKELLSKELETRLRHIVDDAFGNEKKNGPLAETLKQLTKGEDPLSDAAKDAVAEAICKFDPPAEASSTNKSVMAREAQLILQEFNARLGAMMGDNADNVGKHVSTGVPNGCPIADEMSAVLKNAKCVGDVRKGMKTVIEKWLGTEGKSSEFAKKLVKSVGMGKTIGAQRLLFRYEMMMAGVGENNKQGRLLAYNSVCRLALDDSKASLARNAKIYEDTEEDDEYDFVYENDEPLEELATDPETYRRISWIMSSYKEDVQNMERLCRFVLNGACKDIEIFDKQLGDRYLTDAEIDNALNPRSYDIIIGTLEKCRSKLVDDPEFLLYVRQRIGEMPVDMVDGNEVRRLGGWAKNPEYRDELVRMISRLPEDDPFETLVTADDQLRSAEGRRFAAADCYKNLKVESFRAAFNLADDGASFKTPAAKTKGHLYLDGRGKLKSANRHFGSSVPSSAEDNFQLKLAFVDALRQGGANDKFLAYARRMVGLGTHEQTKPLSRQAVKMVLIEFQDRVSKGMSRDVVPEKKITPQMVGRNETTVTFIGPDDDPWRQTIHISHSNPPSLEDRKIEAVPTTTVTHPPRIEQEPVVIQQQQPDEVKQEPKVSQQPQPTGDKLERVVIRQPQPTEVKQEQVVIQQPQPTEVKQEPVVIQQPQPTEVKLEPVAQKQPKTDQVPLNKTLPTVKKEPVKTEHVSNIKEPPKDEPKNQKAESGFIPPSGHVSPSTVDIWHPTCYSDLWREPADLFKRIILFTKASSFGKNSPIRTLDHNESVVDWIKGMMSSTYSTYVSSIIGKLPGLAGVSIPANAISITLAKAIQTVRDSGEEDPVAKFDMVATEFARALFSKGGMDPSSRIVGLTQYALAKALVSSVHIYAKWGPIIELGGGLVRADGWTFRDGAEECRSSILPRADVEKSMMLDTKRTYHLTGLSRSSLSNAEDTKTYMSFLRFGEVVIDHGGRNSKDDLFQELAEQTFLNNANLVKDAKDGDVIKLPIVRTDLGGQELIECNTREFSLTFTPPNASKPITVKILPQPEHFCLPIDSKHSDDTVINEKEMALNKAAWKSMRLRAQAYDGPEKEKVQLLMGQIDWYFTKMLNSRKKLPAYVNFGAEFTRLGARIGVLAALLGDVPSVNCTWGRDRTGVMDNEFKLTMLKLRAGEKLPEIQLPKNMADPDIIRRTRLLESTGNNQIAHQVTLTHDPVDIHQFSGSFRDEKGADYFTSGLPSLFAEKRMPKIAMRSQSDDFVTLLDDAGLDKAPNQICDELLKGSGYHVKNNKGMGHCFFYSALDQMDPDDQLTQKWKDIGEFRKALVEHLESRLLKQSQGKLKGLSKVGGFIYVKTSNGDQPVSDAFFPLQVNNRKNFLDVRKGVNADVSHAAFLADMLKRPVIVISPDTGTSGASMIKFERDLETGEVFDNKEPIIMYYNRIDETTGHFQAVLKK